MAYICPNCNKLLQERKEMRYDAIGKTRGLSRYLYCNICNMEIKNPVLKEIKMR